MSTILIVKMNDKEWSVRGNWGWHSFMCLIEIMYVEKHNLIVAYVIFVNNIHFNNYIFIKCNFVNKINVIY